MNNKESLWRVLSIFAALLIFLDSRNIGPTDITLILHEVGHWISALIFTFQVPQIRFNFARGSGICYHGGTLLPFDWIIAIMGAGFQNIVGAVVYRISKPKGFGHVLRAMGLTLYAVGWFDIRIIEAGFLHPLASDFANYTIPKLILYLFLNYYLIRYVIGGSTSQTGQFSIFQEFMIQAGYRKRSDVVINSAKKTRKKRLNNFGTEFLYQAGIKQRPSQFRVRSKDMGRY